MDIDKLAINWQNFAQVGLQLKFDFRIRPWVYIMLCQAILCNFTACRIYTLSI